MKKNIASRLQEDNPDMFARVMALKAKQYEDHAIWLKSLEKKDKIIDDNINLEKGENN